MATKPPIQSRNKIKPIKPEELSKFHEEEHIPDFVIEGINNAIKKYSYGKKEFNIKQDLIVAEILAFAPKEFKDEELYDKHYLDFEPLFRKHGWVINYDKPGYDENYDASFTFKIK